MDSLRLEDCGCISAHVDFLGANEIEFNEHLVRLDEILKDHAVTLDKDITLHFAEQDQLKAVGVDQVDKRDVHTVSADGGLEGEGNSVGGIGHARVLSRAALVSS